MPGTREKDVSPDRVFSSRTHASPLAEDQFRCYRRPRLERVSLAKTVSESTTCKMVLEYFEAISWIQYSSLIPLLALCMQPLHIARFGEDIAVLPLLDQHLK
jgi:hypothetical protein